MKQQTQRLGLIKITDFAMKHFDPEFGGTKILNLEAKDFETYLNQFSALYFDKPDERMIDKAQGIVRVNILDGYAPFCKLLVMKNITDCRTGTLPIDYEHLANRQYLRTGYSSRRKGELAVPTSWLDLPVRTPQAEYTVTVLYNKEQLDKEALAMFNKTMTAGGIDSVGLEEPTPFSADWGVVAILGQMQPQEEPMKPMTMMRNYLPIGFGGSGMQFPVIPVEPDHFDFDNEEQFNLAKSIYRDAVVKYKEDMEDFTVKYEKSVKFWENNATVK